MVRLVKVFCQTLTRTTNTMRIIRQWEKTHGVYYFVFFFHSPSASLGLPPPTWLIKYGWRYPRERIAGTRAALTLFAAISARGCLPVCSCSRAAERGRLSHTRAESRGRVSLDYFIRHVISPCNIRRACCLKLFAGRVRSLRFLRRAFVARYKESGISPTEFQSR